MENRERGIGWPLGLGSMYMRLRSMENLSIGASDRRSPFYFPSSSFSSFTSSSLDTESTSSFFQDNSKSLGRLIGIRPHNKRSAIHNTNNTIDNRNRSEAPHKSSTLTSKHEDELYMEMCDGICVTCCLVAKMSKNKDGSKR